MEDELALRDDQQQVIDALRELPPRQRDCLVLRYYDELGIDDLASTLGISPNSVKTHLKRGLRALEERLAAVGVELAGHGAGGGVVTAVEELLRGALLDGTAALDESDDLFARVQLSIEDDRTAPPSTSPAGGCDRLPPRRDRGRGVRDN